MENLNKEQVNCHLFYTMDTAKTDVGVILGCRSVSGSAAREALRLYHEKAIDQVVVSGGARVFQLSTFFALISMLKFKTLFSMMIKGQLLDFFSFKKEASYIADILRKGIPEEGVEGVPEEKIHFVERESKYTSQNFENIAHCMKDFNSATIVAYSPQQRRALGTARSTKGFEEDSMKLRTHAVYPFNLGRHNWDDRSVFFIRPIKLFVEQELKKIDPQNPNSYVGKYYKEIDVKAENAAFKLG